MIATLCIELCSGWSPRISTFHAADISHLNTPSDLSCHVCMGVYFWSLGLWSPTILSGENDPLRPSQVRNVSVLTVTSTQSVCAHLNISFNAPRKRKSQKPIFINIFKKHKMIMGLSRVCLHLYKTTKVEKCM